jgi:DNA ligase-1
MKVFATLINALESTNKITAKLDAIMRFLEEADERDKIWFLALFNHKRPKRPIQTSLLKQWAIEVAQVSEWLFQECYAAVGDLSETIALILPPPTENIQYSLATWMDLILDLNAKSEAEKKDFVLRSWNGLSNIERFIFNKLLGGSFRVGVSSKTLINALAKYYNLDENAVAHSIMGDWNIEEVNFEALVRGHYINTNLSKPYPFCLAYPLDRESEKFDALELWQAEYKWDGIRGQFIKRGDEIFIWSRGEELVTDQFPEIRNALLQYPNNFVIDGEILVIENHVVKNFSELQKRLNRKSITKKLMDEFPVAVYAYDLLEWEGEDWRNRPLKERRLQLEYLLRSHDATLISISETLPSTSWDDLTTKREHARSLNAEGLMLKHKESIYHSGRKRGDWWKWKIDPLSIDAVLIYAQKGSGRRSAHYTDYTFAIKDGEKLVSIAKAYSGLTDKEIQAVSKFINANAIEKFGPVRTVKPELVFEIGFEGISFSNRHKSGVALRFPRILRWRKDKTVDQIDQLSEVVKLIR